MLTLFFLTLLSFSEFSNLLSFGCISTHVRAKPIPDLFAFNRF